VHGLPGHAPRPVHPVTREDPGSLAKPSGSLRLGAQAVSELDVIATNSQMSDGVGDLFAQILALPADVNRGCVREAHYVD
jgi:hypothetical protein